MTPEHPAEFAVPAPMPEVSAEPAPMVDAKAENLSGPEPALGLAELFRRHHAELVRLAVLLVRDRQTAEDVVQDVFTRIHARRGRMPRPEGAVAYLRAAVLNGCRSVLRHRAVTSRLGFGRRSLTAYEPAGNWLAAHGPAGPRLAEHGLHESAESAAIRAEDRRHPYLVRFAVPSGRPLAVLYDGQFLHTLLLGLGLGSASLASDSSGRYLLLDINKGFLAGWVHHGQLHLWSSGPGSGNYAPLGGVPGRLQGNVDPPLTTW